MHAMRAIPESTSNAEIEVIKVGISNREKVRARANDTVLDKVLIEQEIFRIWGGSDYECIFD